MDPSQYSELVLAAEANYARDPEAHRRRMARFVSLGYAYVAVIVGAVAAGLLGVVVTIANGIAVAPMSKLAFALGVVLVVILRALDVRFEPPKGTPVSPGDATRFLERVDEIRRAVDAPEPDEILLNSDFNASVTQIPETGPVGTPRTYLVIGVPLLYALSPEQLDAVLAHEFGHLSGSHPKHGLRVWRMARIWHQLMTQLEQKNSIGAAFFDGFFHWYVPRLHAYGFAMSRGDELEADDDAARVASPRAMGEALTALALRGRFLNDVFWPNVMKSAAEQPEPVNAFYALPGALRESNLGSVRRDWIAEALRARPDTNDTHPSLLQRLVHLGLLPEEGDGQIDMAEPLLTDLHRSAAEEYFPGLAQEWLETSETEWKSEVTKPWRERFDAVRAKKERLTELSARDRRDQGQGADELWEIAAISSSLNDTDAALDAAQRCLAAREDHAQAHFLVGQVLLSRGDDACEHHLRRAMELDPEATPAVARVLYSLYQSREDEAGMQRMQEQFDAWVQMMHEAEAERRHVNVDDTFAPPDLQPEELDSIQGAVDSMTGIRDVLVVRKLTKRLPAHPHFVLLLRFARFSFRSRQTRQELVTRFADAVRLRGDFFVQVERGAFERLGPLFEDRGAVRVTAAA